MDRDTELERLREEVRVLREEIANPSDVVYLVRSESRRRCRQRTKTIASTRAAERQFASIGQRFWTWAELWSVNLRTGSVQMLYREEFTRPE